MTQLNESPDYDPIIRTMRFITFRLLGRATLKSSRTGRQGRLIILAELR